LARRPIALSLRAHNRAITRRCCSIGGNRRRCRLGFGGSYAVLQNVWSIRSLRLQIKIDNLLDEQYEQAIGFSSQSISVRGGIAVNF
jgi:hypothetical protein